jgi:autotransporter passenger strand-loop-strand repeat protein
LASGAVISAGLQVVEVAGTASTTVVELGEQDVFGTAVGTILSGGSQIVEASGTASGTTVLSGALETVSAGGVDLGANISGGAQLDFGLASGVTVFAGSQVVEAGGRANGTTVDSGATLVVDAGGNASGTKLNSGATLEVFGTVSGTVVSSGVTFVVEPGGVASATTIQSGGTETVSAGGTDRGASVSGGVQLDFGLASGVTVFTGSQVVESGGVASGTNVDSGGTLVVDAGGNARGVTLNSGATLEVFGTVSGTTVNNGVSKPFADQNTTSAHNARVSSTAIRARPGRGTNVDSSRSASTRPQHASRKATILTANDRVASLSGSMCTAAMTSVHPRLV